MSELIRNNSEDTALSFISMSIPKIDQDPILYI